MAPHLIYKLSLVPQQQGLSRRAFFNIICHNSYCFSLEADVSIVSAGAYVAALNNYMGDPAY
jgi:hypothetical protein